MASTGGSASTTTARGRSPGPEGGEPEAKRRREQLKCAVCLRDEGERGREGEAEAKLRRHGCSTCKEGAWSICEDCHRQLVSRECPLCRSSYEAEPLFPFPLKQSNAHRVLFHSMVKSCNVVIFSPASRLASFLLSPGSEGVHVAVKRIPLAPGLLDSEGGESGAPKYRFDLALWEALESADEDKIYKVPVADVLEAFTEAYDAVGEQNVVLTPLPPDTLSSMVEQISRISKARLEQLQGTTAKAERGELSGGPSR